VVATSSSAATEPGRVEAHWYDNEELEDAWEDLQVACLALWKQAKKYESGW
jgi:hypothetical protein